MPDKYAGKKVRCKKCNEIFVAPQTDQNEDHMIQLDDYDHLINEPTANITEEKQPSPQSDTSSSMPLWTWCLLGFLGLCFISFVLYMLVFRDTWERDHYSEISGMIRETQSYIYEEDLESATNLYNQLSDLIAGRHIKKENLKENFANVKAEYEMFKGKIEKERKEEKRIALAKAEEERKIAEEEKREKQLSETKKMKEDDESKRKQEVLDNPTRLTSSRKEHWASLFLGWHESRHPPAAYFAGVGLKNVFQCTLAYGRSNTKKGYYRPGNVFNIVWTNDAFLSIEEVYILKGSDGFDNVNISVMFFDQTTVYMNDSYLSEGYTIAAIFRIPIESSRSDRFAAKVKKEGSITIAWHAFDPVTPRKRNDKIKEMAFDAIVYWYSLGGETSYTDVPDTTSLWYDIY